MYFQYAYLVSLQLRANYHDTRKLSKPQHFVQVAMFELLAEAPSNNLNALEDTESKPIFLVRL